MTVTSGFKFPFSVTAAGAITASDNEDEHLRGKIIQVLFTAPGERVNMPEFGCGLFNLVFEPSNPILVAATEFTVGQALTRWLGDEIVVDGIDITSIDETVTIEIAYTKKVDVSRQAVRVHFR